MPESATTGSRVHSPWKRSACDRCRSQKLRCLRQEDDTTTSSPCLRCIRCRTPCYTSSAKPLGRPCKSAARARQQRGQSTEGPQHNRPTPRSHSGSLPITHSPVATMAAPSMEDYTPPGDDLSLYDYFVDPCADLGGGLFGDRPHAQLAMQAPSLAPPLELFKVDQDTVFVSSEADAHTIDPGVVLAGLHHNLSRQLYLVRTVAWDVRVLATSGPTSLKAEANPTPSDLNPLATVVGTTADFLEVARLFRCPNDDVFSSLGSDFMQSVKSEPMMPSTPSLSSPSLPPSVESPLLPHSLYPSPILSSLLSPPPPSSVSSASTTLAHDPSTAQLLTILSCYLQVVAIYDAILAHVLVGLPRVPGADGMLHGTQGMFFTSYTLSGQSRLLMRLLLQVVEHEFTLIERALGIPAGFCVSANAFFGPGLLAGREAKALLGTIAGLAFDGGDGRGGLRAVASLQDNMKRARQML